MKILMTISTRQIIELQEWISGSAPASPKAETERERFHIGAIWYGNWLDDADRGSFGTPDKRNHNACISIRNQVASFFTLAPITKQMKTAKNTVALPAGTIPGGEFCVSYVLFRFKLAARRETLKRMFIYKTSLPPQYIQEIRTRMNANRER